MGIVTRLVLAVSLAALPVPSVADPGNGKGHLKAAGPVVVGAPSRHRWAGCPPGLAKKGNGCQPPGHARKARPVVVDPGILGPMVVLPHAARPAPRPVVAPPPRRASTLVITPAVPVVGQRYDGAHYVTDPRLYGLAPAPAGQRYGIAGNRLVRLDEGTGTVLALIGRAETIRD